VCLFTKNKSVSRFVPVREKISPQQDSKQIPHLSKWHQDQYR
jgi:hypothetical protein